jgi:uncharacterized protein YrrD
MLIGVVIQTQYEYLRTIIINKSALFEHFKLNRAISIQSTAIAVFFIYRLQQQLNSTMGSRASYYTELSTRTTRNTTNTTNIVEQYLQERSILRS